MIKRGQVFTSKSGSKYAAVALRDPDDAPRTVRLLSLRWGTVGTKRWTEQELLEAGARSRGRIVDLDEVIQ